MYKFEPQLTDNTSNTKKSCKREIVGRTAIAMSVSQSQGEWSSSCQIELRQNYSADSVCFRRCKPRNGEDSRVESRTEKSLKDRKYYSANTIQKHCPGTVPASNLMLLIPLSLTTEKEDKSPGNWIQNWTSGQGAEAKVKLEEIDSKQDYTKGENPKQKDLHQKRGLWAPKSQQEKMRLHCRSLYP